MLSQPHSPTRRSALPPADGCSPRRFELPGFRGVARTGLRAEWTARLGSVPLERRSNLWLFRLISAYLDQGLAIWRMPRVEELGFFDTVAHLARESAFPLGPLASPTARALLERPPADALAAALARTLAGEALWEQYLLETLLAQPGWAGLAAECERKPELLINRRKIRLLDYAAITLIAEVGCLERELGEFAPLAAVAAECVPDRVPDRSADEVLLAVWHDAFEWSYYEPLLGALAAPRPARTTESVPARAWAFFCSTIARARCAVTSRRSSPTSRRSASPASSALTLRTAAQAMRSQASTVPRR